MKNVMIFGSTGSIGQNALDVIRKGNGSFKVMGLLANKDTDTLSAQIREFSPKYICAVNPKSAGELKKSIPKGVKLFSGEEGLEEFSKIPCDISVMAVPGISCLKPLLTNIRHAKRIALANKESIVTAGNFVFKEAARHKTEIIPIDSEINALFQLIGSNLNGKTKEGSVYKIYITASGGALFDYAKTDLKTVTVKDVLSHPTWKMGKRITVDSATLVNKGFETVEAHYFFNLPYEKIDILIHRESTIHALAELKDRTIFACVYPADMRIPISFALNYPERVSSGVGVDFQNRCSFTFSPISFESFPLLKLILDAAKREDNGLAILNACDETAIDYFLRKKIRFTDIHRVMEHMSSHYPSRRLERVEDVFYWDEFSRAKTKEYFLKL